MKVNRSHQKFGTPIEVGTVPTKESNNPESRSVDEQTDEYLSGRRKRKLEEAKAAELEHVAEEEKTGAARQRKQRELIEGGVVSPMGNKEGEMESTDEKVEAAAEVAAEAAGAGVDPKDAKDLGTGKKPVVIINPLASEGTPDTEGKGWSVLDGKPVRDPEGEYSFNQALKVASLGKEKAEGDSMSFFKWLKSEGFLGGEKGDEFMGTFMKELAKQSVNNIIRPPNSSGSSDVQAIAMREEIKGLREEFALATDPVASAKRVKEMFDTFRSLGMIPEASSGGESLETVKETHRHEEKMEELGTEKEYKRDLTKIASEIPERIGQGIGSDIMEGEGEGESSGESLEYFGCTEEGCDFKIPITPETKQITCPKCGAIYQKKGTTVETKPGTEEK